MDLSVQLGRLALRNPILVASGTFGYAREFDDILDVSCLGGVIPKTVTRHPRPGNQPPRTVETPSGLLNSIGLDNDGIDYFLSHHLPLLVELPTATIVNIAGRSREDFVELAERLDRHAGIAGIELNVSCPNVAGGVDFGIDPEATARLVRDVRGACAFPILAKLTPNVTDIVAIAQSAAESGADAVSLVNTFLGIAVNWLSRKPILGGVTGGLSGPAIKPLALRCVWQVARALSVPIVGVGGISTVDDAMEFIVSGASAIQIGTANFFDPNAAARIARQLPDALRSTGVSRVSDLVGTALRYDGHADPKSTTAVQPGSSSATSSGNRQDLQVR